MAAMIKQCGFQAHITPLGYSLFGVTERSFTGKPAETPQRGHSDNLEQPQNARNGDGGGRERGRGRGGASGGRGRGRVQGGGW